jgi:hypothetical protein
MGRGRQKAKNTKVARELKYFSPNTDLTALQAELGTTSDEQEYEDKWADLYPEDEPATPDADSSTSDDSSKTSDQ